MFAKLFDRLFKRRQAAAPAQNTEKRRPDRSGRGSPLLPEAGDELIRKMLPRVFQRTHKDLRIAAGPDGRAAGMDAAPDCGLPDVWGLQNTVPAVVFDWFGAHSFIGHQACALLAQHWLVDKACGQAPKDAVQNGFTPVPTLPEGDAPPELVKEINAQNTALDILGQCREFARNARIFGIRHALFVVDGLDYAAPFNPDGVRPGSYRGISQIDPYWLTPEFDHSAIADPAARHFYEPTWWRLPGGQRVHRSHFVIARESEVPDLLKPTYYYGGLPLPQLIYERVYAAERVANEAPELAMTKRLTVMQGQIENYITDEAETTERLHAFNQVRSNFGFMVVGEGEIINQHDTSLADFDALVMTQYQLVAAIARTPATKLLGTTPKGFNATGEHESDSYDQELASIQSNCMTPLLDRHHLLLCRSSFADRPGLTIATTWNPVRKLKPAEVATINLQNAQAAQLEASLGAISGDEERDRLRADVLSPYQNLLDGEAAGFEPDDDDPLLAGSGMDAGNFKEDDHPRGDDGKFGRGGASGGGKAQDIGKLLGEEHKGVKGQAAIAKLLATEGGHVKGAFERTDIGKIDLAWGDDTFGLKHIMQRRAEQGLDPHRFVADLAQVVERGKLRAKDDGRFVIAHNDKAAVVTRELRGNQLTLLLTAFETDRPSPAAGRKKRR